LRDWSSGTSGIRLGFGSQNGSKYMQKLINSNELNGIKDLNCYLMSTPNLKADMIEVNLSQLNNQFKLDLQNLMHYKLLNNDEIQRKYKPKTNECIKADELFHLFETCVKKLNEEKECLCLQDLESSDYHNRTEDDSSKTQENWQQPKPRTKFGPTQVEEKQKITDNFSTENIDKDKDVVKNLTSEQSSSYCNRNDKNDENCESSLKLSTIKNTCQVGNENAINNGENSNQAFDKPDHTHEDYRG
jgi:hypothetical protein